jgi:hypothetical protein
LIGSLALSDSDRQIAMIAASFDRMPPVGKVGQGLCRLLTVDGDAWFAGIAVSESATAASRLAPAVARRRIDVIVKRPGKVALYLEKSSGRRDWQIPPSAQTQITNVVLSEAPGWLSRVRGAEPLSHVFGLEPSVRIQRTSDCNSFQPRGHAYLGGPAALELDRDLQIQAGRGLDALLRRTNDGSWPPATGDHDAPRVTLVIE